MKSTIVLFVVFFLFSLTLTSCKKLEVEKEVPNCIRKKIKNIKKENVRNPAARIWEWKLDGNTYYYITSDCCDQFNYLYDANCTIICAPDGGITGMGDGNCTQFNGQIEKTLIWQDDRK